MHKIIEDLNWRYATKNFDENKKVSREDLNTLMEVFRLTPSSFGLQPWKLVVVQDQALKDTLVEHSWGQQQIGNCSDLLVLCRKNNFSEENIGEFVADIKKTRGVSQEDIQGYEDMMKGAQGVMDTTWTDKQIYIALGNLMTACASMQIDSCPVEGFVAKKYDEVLNLSDKGLSSVVVLPIGYRSDDDYYAALGKVRFSQEELIIKI